MQIPLLKPAFVKPALRAEPARARRNVKRITVCVLVGLSLALMAEAGRVLFGTNFHEVLPGRVYRSAQLSPEKLRSTIQKHNIRTIINLRGCCVTFDWYRNEASVAQDLNVSMEDITLSATRLPARNELIRLIEVLDRCEYPVLFHCRQGADRTSLASALALLLVSDADLKTARQQCTLRFAHLPILATREMDRFLEMYGNWLDKNGGPHSPARFREWVTTVYTPDPAPARLEWLESPGTVRVGQPVTARVRATNISKVNWEFKPGTCAGVHARYVLQDELGNVIGLYRAGRFEATVPPGGSIEIAIPLPPLRVAGKFWLTVDLAARDLNFGQLGSEYLEMEIEVE